MNACYTSASDIVSTVGFFERITTEARLKNQEMLDFQNDRGSSNGKSSYGHPRRASLNSLPTESNLHRQRRVKLHNSGANDLTTKQANEHTFHECLKLQRDDETIQYCITAAVETFERMTTEAHQKNQGMHSSGNERCGDRSKGVPKNAQMSSPTSCTQKLRWEDETEATADESTDFSDSFSLSCSSLGSSWHNNPRLGQQRYPYAAAQRNCMTKLEEAFPLELEEDESSRASVPSKTIEKCFSANIEDWEILKILGEGAFGQVAQVERVRNGDGDRNCYALKMLSKFQLVSDGLVDVVITEKNLLRAASQHPFVVRLRAAWQDDNLIYLLQDFIQGGELFSLLLQTDDVDGARDKDFPQRKALPVRHAQFYAACIADALNYLHSKCSIVYRDLKPENVLLDGLGYPVLIDLGAAKLLTEDDGYRALTLCGTPRYLSPEQISGLGHSFGVDHWALAVLVYEMVTAVHPFDEWDGADEFALYRTVVNDHYRELSSPVFVEQAHFRDWIDHLLVKDPDQRLGGKAQSQRNHDHGSALQLHPWLSSMDATALRGRLAPAPWVPRLVDLHDSTHFDDWEHLDPIVQTQYPKLTSREAAMFAAFDDE